MQYAQYLEKLAILVARADEQWDEEITYQILLIADNGLVIDSDFGTLSENEVLEFVNLSGNSWDPDPGERSIVIRALDERGFEIGFTQKSFDVREPIGMSARGKLRLLMERLESLQRDLMKIFYKVLTA